MVSPVLTFAAQLFLVKHLLRIQNLEIQHVAPILLSSLAWYFFYTSIMMCMPILQSRSEFIKNYSFNSTIFIVFTFFENIVNTIIVGGFLTCAIFLKFGGQGQLSLSFVHLFFSAFNFVLFTFCLCLTIALLNLRFVDLKFILPTLLQALFFLSPILYTAHLNTYWGQYIKYNPLYYYLSPLQQSLSFNGVTLYQDASVYTITLAITLVTLVSTLIFVKISFKKNYFYV